jgi:hypothetical protein
MIPPSAVDALERSDVTAPKPALFKLCGVDLGSLTSTLAFDGCIGCANPPNLIAILPALERSLGTH